MLVEGALLCGFILTLIYYRMTRKWGIFVAQGVAEVPSSFPFGSPMNRNMMTGKSAIPEAPGPVYWDYPDEKIVGAFDMGQPTLYINDIEIIKHVLIKDFDHFTDRRNLELNQNVESNRYFMHTLKFLNGESWKKMRLIMSPVFTSGKLKFMMPVVMDVADTMIEHFEPMAAKKVSFDCKDHMLNFTAEVISRCGLGIEANAFKNPEGLIREIKSLAGDTSTGFWQGLKLVIFFTLPALAKRLPITFTSDRSMRHMIDVIRKSMEARKKSGSRRKRHDFIELFLKAMEESESEDANVETEDQFEKDAQQKHVSPSLMRKKFNDEEIELYMISNAMVLFLAGLDTSSTMMSVCLYFLAKNLRVQEQLREEIDRAVMENNGDKHLEYNVVQTLPYLDKIINESLRLYPLIFEERVCVKSYKIPGTNFTVPKGMLVQIPHMAIMRDPKFYPNPNNFDPENFSAENRAARSPYAFLPFGIGPRNCIGMRFALLQMKVSIFRIIADYKVLPCGKTVNNLIHDPFSTSSMPKGRIWVRIEKRDES